MGLLLDSEREMKRRGLFCSAFAVEFSAFDPAAVHSAQSGHMGGSYGRSVSCPRALHLGSLDEGGRGGGAVLKFKYLPTAAEPTVSVWQRLGPVRGTF